MLWKVFDNSSDSQRFLSDDFSDHLQSRESVSPGAPGTTENQKSQSRMGTPSEKSYLDRHWNSRTNDDHRTTDRTHPVSEGGSQNPVHDAERHQLHPLAAVGANQLDDVKDLGGHIGLEATVRSCLRQGCQNFELFSYFQENKFMMVLNIAPSYVGQVPESKTQSRDSRIRHVRSIAP